MLIVVPLVNAVVLKLMSEPEVPTLPCTIRVVEDAATQVEVVELVQIRKCAAVPVADAVALVIALNVNTPPVTVPAVAERGSTARTVPLSTVAALAGCAPVRITM